MSPNYWTQASERNWGFFMDIHAVFCLGEHGRGETELVEMRFLTEEAEPCKLPAHRMLFVVRQEMACQLKVMRVIQPSGA